MKKIMGILLALALAVSVLSAAADGIDGAQYTLCRIEGHQLTVNEQEWCTRTDCAVCKEVTFAFGTVDVNDDGEMNIKDLIRLKKYQAGDSVTVTAAADVNCDGANSAEDLTTLSRVLLGVL